MAELKQELENIKIVDELAQIGLAKRLKNIEKRISALESKGEKKYRLRVDFDKIINLKYSNAMMLVLAQKLGGLNNKKCYFAVPGENEPKIEFTQSEIDTMGDITRGFVKEEICEK